MSGLLYTKYCVICKDPAKPITSAGGHVIRKRTYINDFIYNDVAIIASVCQDHKDVECGPDGYLGEYTEDMGICDNPFQKQEPKKLAFKDIPVGHKAQCVQDKSIWLRCKNGGVLLQDNHPYCKLSWFSEWSWIDLGKLGAENEE